MRWGNAVHGLLQVIAEHSPDDITHIYLFQFGCSRGLPYISREPFPGPFQDRLCRKVRQLQFRMPCRDKSNAPQEIPDPVREIEHAGSLFRCSLAYCPYNPVPHVSSQRPGVHCQASYTGFQPGSHTSCTAVPCDIVPGPDHIRYVLRIERSREKYPSRIVFAGIHHSHGNPFVRRHSVVHLNTGHISACQLEMPAIVSGFRHSFRICCSNKGSGKVLARLSIVFGAFY